MTDPERRDLEASLRALRFENVDLRPLRRLASENVEHDDEAPWFTEARRRAAEKGALVRTFPARLVIR